MNGIHDMGGMTTFGPVPRDETSPFHAEWEKRFAGVAVNTPVLRSNDDQFRDALERLDPAVYLSTTYYERWLAGLERLFVEIGVISEEEMAAALEGWKPQPGIAPVEAGAEEAQAGGDRDTRRYSPGDRVRVRNANPPGHTRMPRYVRDRRGVVDRFLSIQAVPEEFALGDRAPRQPVYAVRFTARELWGEGASPRDSVVIDLWEDYLLPDDEGQEET